MFLLGEFQQVVLILSVEHFPYIVFMVIQLLHCLHHGMQVGYVQDDFLFAGGIVRRTLVQELEVVKFGHEFQDLRGVRFEVGKETRVCVLD